MPAQRRNLVLPQAAIHRELAAIELAPDPADVIGSLDVSVLQDNLLAPVLGYLPMASLAALLLLVAWNMSEAKHFAHALRVAPKSDVAVLLLCFGLTVIFDLTWQLVIAHYLLSAALLIAAGADVKASVKANPTAAANYLLGTIHAAEASVETFQQRVVDPAVMVDHVKLHEAYDELAKAQHEVERLYARWAELDAKHMFRSMYADYLIPDNAPGALPDDVTVT